MAENKKRKATPGSFKFGNTLQRDKKWATPEDLQADIDKYFKRCDSNTVQKVNANGIPYSVKKPIHYSVEGIAVALDVDRATLLNYEKAGGYEAYFNIIKKAKQKVLQNNIERAAEGDSSTAFTIFLLKNNFGFADKQERDVNVKGSLVYLDDDEEDTIPEEE